MGAVVVVAVTPMHEQADEYLMAPEQAEAYAGILNGATVCWRGSIIPPSRFISTKDVTVATVIMVVLSLTISSGSSHKNKDAYVGAGVTVVKK